MGNQHKMIAFGPVPSRRFGQSLGINNIPPKICSYSCIYCQLGRTSDLLMQRKSFYKPKAIKDAVNNKITQAGKRKERIDYLTFVPDGEPTLDINLGKEIDILKSFDVNIAVITNASLLWKKDVRDDLSKVDCISLKIDAVNDIIWKKINRPHRSLNMSKLLAGVKRFSETYPGDLIIETMLIKDVTDNFKELTQIADFIEQLHPQKSYLSLPTRPPAERWVTPVDEQVLNTAFQIFKSRGISVELLTHYEGNAFAFTGNVVEDLLSITSVHPMRKEGIERFLEKADVGWDVVETLIKTKKLIEVRYKESTFYLRKLPGKK